MEAGESSAPGSNKLRQPNNQQHQEQHPQFKLPQESQYESPAEVVAPESLHPGGTQHKARPITHRSQSSPSSLITHKFGLKPTPSPPRLIIDHNTGDIVESYPDQPIYLKTYQPLDEDELLLDNQPSSITDDNTLDDSLAHPYPPPLQTSHQLDEYNKILLNHYKDQHQFASSGEESLSQGMSNRHNRPAIPPPHSGKVYFAPPAMSGGGGGGGGHQQQLYHHQNSSLTSGEPVDERPLASSFNQAQHFAPNSSFKRALNKLNENTNTDIAILTDEQANEENFRALSEPSVSHTGGQQVKITATSASKANALLLQKQNQKQTSSNPSKCSNTNHARQFKREMPNIEDFNLYNFCYIFRLLLVCSISIYVIYLLVGPLHLDCNFYRPTFTYLSIIVSSVNLIFIVIFSLFWYCNGVTRTLYSNLSSSAFIIAIYSILVAINLILAILFFLINTCHFQKLMNTRSSLVHLSIQSQPEVPRLSNVPSDELPLLLTRRHLIGPSSSVSSIKQPHSQLELSLKRLEEEEERAKRGRRKTDCEDNDDDCAESNSTLFHNELPADLEDYLSEQHGKRHEKQAEMLTESPFEAAWEYTKTQFREFKKNFRDFVIKYDFRFIGSLHALCAICLQYMAMKVAIVRSHFCSPVGSSYV